MSTNAAGPRAVVVGAGPAGLATALRLERRFPGRDEVLVLDRSGVAASWRARYAELRLNTTRSTSALPGRPIPRSAGRWPSRDDYVGYLEAAASSLRTPPQTGVRVLRVVGDPGRGWTVVTDVGPVSTLNVVVATGHDAVPHIPDWAKGTSYRGELQHVGNLGRLADFAGRRVVVVGAGNSGIDIVGHLAGVGAETVVAMRTPPTIVPREHLGIPVQRVAVATRWLPVRTRDAMASATARLTTGDLARYGVPRPSVGPYTRFARSGVTVAVDSGFVQALRDGRVRVVPAAVGLTPHGLQVADGSVIDADVVILATGFRCGLEQLVGHLGVLDPTGRPLPPLPGPTASAEGLFFAGFRPAVDGTLRRHAADARDIASRVRNRTH
jgi:cation diffusion facilitator CzcD-associated flavoprotein CzcO